MLDQVVHPVPPGGLVMETRVLVLGGRAAVAAKPQGAKLSLPRIGQEATDIQRKVA